MEDKTKLFRMKFRKNPGKEERPIPQGIDGPEHVL
jgi:hypothetical protein